jgi:hypothetical protein
VIALTDKEQAAGFVRPLRTRVIHNTPACGRPSAMGVGQAEDLARDPKDPQWSTCWCGICGRRLPIDQFTWADGSPVGS